ncbi:10119_t:CDS:2 [Dentiscutata erythropus]|uniref:10119_t:CDS:1 n=1 Tax=Dentiscutata erythropus TaxID=1348616 RepID=A0A9N8YTX6_9GLOM|nr:10119_t:CDS:2 [Dentiscutata erythropus]
MSEQPKGEDQENQYDYNEFNILEQIGEGAYGKIYKAIWNREIIALKRPNPSRDKKYICKEIETITTTKKNNSGKQLSMIKVNIKVVNPSIKSYKFEFSNEEKLNHVRKMILNEEKTNDIEFDYFVNKNNEPILHEEESNISLESILRPSTSIDCFDVQIVDVWTELIEMIKKGFIFRNNLVEYAPKAAFKINKDKIISKTLNDTDEQKKLCKHELDILCNRNLISYGDISTILPWLSIFLGMPKESSKQKLKDLTSTEILLTKSIRAEISISKECLNLTENFESDVEIALKSCNDKIDSCLREITKNYGYFYARRIVFGGAIIKESDSSKDPSNISSMPELLLSLKDFKNWKIIEYSDIYPIFDLLDDDLRKKVLDVLGYRILKELSKITNIQDCHIFASIMNKNEGVYSLRIEYINDENSPAIVVHNITSKRIQHKYLQIGWIIVGQPNNFDFDIAQTEYPIVLKSKKYSVSSKLGKHYKVEIPKCDNSYIMSTCILEAASETTKETFVVGAHIIPSSHSACIFIHDLKDDLVNVFLYLFGSTIDVNQECNAGQMDINWTKSKTESNIFRGTEKDNCTIFPGNSNFEQAEPSSHNEKIILVNQFFENCCNHGFVNVNYKEIIYKALGTPSLESERIEFIILNYKHSQSSISKS